MSRDFKIGLLILVALATLAVGVGLIGDQRNLFSRTARYSIAFESAGGLAAGNPVQLSGVTVGTVEQVRLPEDVTSRDLTVWINIDRRYAGRLREDSVARIKTLGLLGDKYIDLTSGTPTSRQIDDGGQIPTAPATDVDKLISSGEDAVENVVAISRLLRDLLGRMDKGEGLLGSLVTEGEAKDSIVNTLGSIRTMAERVEKGEGTLGRLLQDESLADEVERTVAKLGDVADSFESGEGVASQLLHDPSTKQTLNKSLEDLSTASEKLSLLADELATGEGLLMRLLRDPDYGAEVSADLKSVLGHLESVARKIDQGEGTAGQLINDEAVYEAVSDMIVGVNESKFLRWLVRNRQKKGIKERYDEERAEAEAAGIEQTTPPSEELP